MLDLWHFPFIFAKFSQFFICVALTVYKKVFSLSFTLKLSCPLTIKLTGVKNCSTEGIWKPPWLYCRLTDHQYLFFHPLLPRPLMRGNLVHGWHHALGTLNISQDVENLPIVAKLEVLKPQRLCEFLCYTVENVMSIWSSILLPGKKYERGISISISVQNSMEVWCTTLSSCNMHTHKYHSKGQSSKLCLSNLVTLLSL